MERKNSHLFGKNKAISLIFFAPISIHTVLYVRASCIIPLSLEDSKSSLPFVCIYTIPMFEFTAVFHNWFASFPWFHLLIENDCEQSNAISLCLSYGANFDSICHHLFARRFHYERVLAQRLHTSGRQSFAKNFTSFNNSNLNE